MALGIGIGNGILFSSNASGGGGVSDDRFIFTVKTDNAGTSASNQFTIPWIGTYDVDWGDGNVDTGVTDAQTHTYATAGTYDVAVTADSGRILFNNGGDKDKLLEIKDWGSCAWTSFNSAFNGCSNLDFLNIINPPNLTNCTDIRDCFRLCIVLGNINGGNIDLSSWDVSNILNFKGFYLAYNYNNLNISNWVINESANIELGIPRVGNLNVSNIQFGNRTSIALMFDTNRIRGFTGLDTWDVSNITNYRRLFRTSQQSYSIIQISNWNIPNGSNLDSMFFGSSKITDLAETMSLMNLTPSSTPNMFGYCNNSEFLNNLDLNHWDMSLCTNVLSMFRDTNQFQQDVFSTWDITNISSFTGFMNNGEGLLTSNYDTTLIAWEQTLQNAYPNGTGYPHTISITFGNSQYTLGGAAETARNSLINNFGWTIVDGGGIFVGLLDEYPNAAAAYSLRELSTAFVGSPVVRVRRSSDNTEQDFTATEITDGTLTTFTGANNGFVTTWYDQSGNNQDAVQATANIQPKIVSNGVLESDNGKPTLNYGLDKRLVTENDNIISQPNTYFTLGRLNNASTSVFFDGRFNDTNRQIYGDLFGGTGIGLSGGVILEIEKYTPETILSTTIFNSTNSKGYVNGIERGVGDAGTRSVNWGTLGNYFNGAGGNFSTQELILYPVNQESNRLPIEENMLNYYTPYGNVISGGFLNTYQGFNGAYSLRKLAEYDNGYDANIVNVRRSSDNVEQNFKATEITDGTLETFVGVGNDGFVTTWYDQSLNKNHLFRSSVSNQPKIVENGVLLLNDGKPALKFDTSDNLSPNQNINSKNVYVVEKTLDLSPTLVGLLGNSTKMWTGGAFGTVTGIAINDSTTTISSNVEDLNTHLIVGEYDTNGALYVDGNLEGTANLNAGNISIVGRRDSYNFNGYIQELLISDLDVSANRTAIETNINNEYNIW